MQQDTTGPSDILKIADTLWPELPRLLGAKGPSVQKELAQLLARARAAPNAEALAEAEDGIFELLATHDPTREEMDRLLPEVDEERGYEPLAGHGIPMAIDRYVCPRGDYSWPVLSVDDPVPPPAVCPVHHTPLIFQPAEGG